MYTRGCVLNPVIYKGDSLTPSTVTWNDQSRAKNHGALTGAVTWAKSPNGLYSPVLDGVAGLISYGNSATLTFGNGLVDYPFTVMAWVIAGVAKHILVKYGTDAAHREWYFRYGGAGKLICDLYDSSVAKEPSRLADDVSTTVWHFAAATYDGRGGATAADGIILYEDGLVKPSTATNQALYVAMESTVQALESGRVDGTFNACTMNIPRICRRVLSPTRIWQIYEKERLTLFGA
jgi:hypothetical protein